MGNVSEHISYLCIYARSFGNLGYVSARECWDFPWYVSKWKGGSFSVVVTSVNTHINFYVDSMWLWRQINTSDCQSPELDFPMWVHVSDDASGCSKAVWTQTRTKCLSKEAEKYSLLIIALIPKSWVWTCKHFSDILYLILAMFTGSKEPWSTQEPCWAECQLHSIQLSYIGSCSIATGLMSTVCQYV